MSISKRDFIRLTGASAAIAALGTGGNAAGAESTKKSLLPRITEDAKPISVDERLARVARAQRLMAKFDIDAILIEPGSAMLYFSGVSWWRSERLTALIIPREGDIAIVVAGVSGGVADVHGLHFCI